MKPLDNIIALAKAQSKRIVLCEGEDPRICAAAVRATAEGLGDIILIGNENTIEGQLLKEGGKLADFQIIDPLNFGKIDEYRVALIKLREHKGMTHEAAVEALKNPLTFAAMLVKMGDADGTIGGAVATTTDTVRAALQIIGRAKGVNTVSSFFLMMLCEQHHTKKGGFIFSDCGLIVEPSVDELVAIASASANSYRDLIGAEPRVAMLSFSTSGSAKHKRVDHIQDATSKLKTRHPELLVDGDIQFDAAFVPAISELKVENSQTRGDANVMVFPSLEAANIGYKIAQRIGGAKAIGPILQGLAKPANDLSRGCDADDVFLMIAVTAAQAIQQDLDTSTL